MVMSLLHTHAPPGRMGEAAGVRMSLVQAMAVAVPLAFGALGATVGLTPVFWSVGLCLATGGAYGRRSRGDAAKPKERAAAVSGPQRVLQSEVLCDNRSPILAVRRMAFVGPLTLDASRPPSPRTSSAGRSAAAAALRFTSLLGLVPLATVAFAFVAQFPSSRTSCACSRASSCATCCRRCASTLVQTYVARARPAGREPQGRLDPLRDGHGGARRGPRRDRRSTRSGASRAAEPLMRRIVVYAIGITAGPAPRGRRDHRSSAGSSRQSCRRSSLAERSAQGGVLTRAAVRARGDRGFTLLYVIAPARRVHWRHGLIGGSSRRSRSRSRAHGFAWYVANSPTYEILYGALAAVPIFMLWVFVFWMIVLAGAAVTCTLAERRDDSANLRESSIATFRTRFASGSNAQRVVHHPGCRLADLAADLRSIIALALIFERLWSLRSVVVAPPGWSTGCSPNSARRGATPELLDKTAQQGPLGRILAAGLANVQSAAPGDEGGDRGGRPRGHARPRALPHHARHDRRDVAAAGPVRHGRRHDRDLRLADRRRHRTRSSSRTASRSRSTTPRWASSSRSRADLLPPLPRARSTRWWSRWSSRRSSWSRSRTASASDGRRA